MFTKVAPSEAARGPMGSSERAAVDTTQVRAQNSALLLRLIWQERQATRVELSRLSGLSHSTVSAILLELERAGLVRTLGATASRGGRPASLIGFSDDSFSIIGVELGARHVAVALTDLRGRVRWFEERRLAVRTQPKAALAQIRGLIEQGVRAERVPLRRVVGIGVAAPSPIDPAAPGHLAELIFPAWKRVDVVAHLQEAYGVPVLIDNDANLGALAERWWGAGVDGGDLAYIKVGAGVGSGHIIRGELYRGATGTAGEIGHVPVDPSGPMCVCGNRGCLTTFIGSEELAERARELFELDEPPTLAEIVRRARSGDAPALRLVDEVGERLGVVVGTLLNLLNMDVVVIGGEISTVGDMLLDAVRRRVRGRALPSAMAHTRIVTSNLGPRAIALGAATLILESALKDYQLFPEVAEEA
jgi:predicted NBD/HSP70 family sugar kinase